MGDWIAAGGVGAMGLVAVAAVWLTHREERRHLLEVLDRFASRSFADYQMGRLVRREVELDQAEDTDDEADERAAVRRFVQQTEADLEAAGVDLGA